MNHLHYQHLNKVRLEECKDVYLNLSNIYAIFCRRYALQHKAIEIFLNNGQSYFFVLESQKIRNELIKFLLTNSGNGNTNKLNKHKLNLNNLEILFSRKPSDI